MPPIQVPSLGRIVQFTCDNGAAAKLNQLGGRRYNVGDGVPGMIVRTHDNQACNLTLFPDAEETMLFANVPYSSGGQPGTWNWSQTVGIAEAA